MQELVLASGNQGKLKELTRLLAPRSLTVRAQSEFNIDTPEETGLSFVENALLKARFVAEKTGLPALADDSGLAVDRLEGAPGIYSARYAGEAASDSANWQKLLHELDGVADEYRMASFHCVLVLMRHPTDPVPLICHGQWRGRITASPQGEHGFGYDPVFWVPEENCTAAQLSPEKKNQLSHRGQALQKLLRELAH